MALIKEMIYQAERKQEIIFDGKYKGYQVYILNLGTHPTAYIEIPKESKLFGLSYDAIYEKDIDIDDEVFKFKNKKTSSRNFKKKK